MTIREVEVRHPSGEFLKGTRFEYDTEAADNSQVDAMIQAGYWAFVYPHELDEPLVRTDEPVSEPLANKDRTKKA